MLNRYAKQYIYTLCKGCDIYLRDNAIHTITYTMDIIKTFQTEGFEKDIVIKGTHENPLFKANDVADLLDIKHIRSVINEFDETEKVSICIKTPGGEQMVNFLTESGLYSLIFRSKKPVAKQFKKWVCEVIKQIRLKCIYQLEQQLKEKEAENS